MSNHYKCKVCLGTGLGGTCHACSGLGFIKIRDEESPLQDAQIELQINRKIEDQNKIILEISYLLNDVEKRINEYIEITSSKFVKNPLPNKTGRVPKTAVAKMLGLRFTSKSTMSETHIRVKDQHNQLITQANEILGQDNNIQKLSTLQKNIKNLLSFKDEILEKFLISSSPEYITNKITKI